MSGYRDNTQGLFLLHGWNHIQGRKEAFTWNHHHFRPMFYSKFARISSTFLQMLFPPSHSERSEASEQLSYYGSVLVFVLQNVFVSLPLSPGCAQTASLQPCLSFCPLQQTPAETENQSLLQSPIIWNPRGTQIHTTWPKKEKKRTSLSIPNLCGDVAWISYHRNFTVTVSRYTYCTGDVIWQTGTLWAYLLCYLRFRIQILRSFIVKKWWAKRHRH